MVSRSRRPKGVTVVSVFSVLLGSALIAGCGSLSESDDGGDAPVRVGTMSTPTTLDPAGAWDSSWELYFNTFQSLVHFPKTGTTPEPDAAESCGFTDNKSQVYRCTLRKGLKFTSGNKLDAKAVKHSFDRILKINSKAGPAPLLESVDEVEASGEHTVIFHLERPNATFPLILSTPAGSVVDPAEYPADKLREGDEIIGSGPYKLTHYAPGEVAELEKYEDYRGPAEMRNEKAEIRYYSGSDELVKALKAKEIDLTYRGLTPEQIRSIQNDTTDSDLTISEAISTEIRMLAFNPEDEAAADPAVREAVAQLVDRKALVRNVYKRTAEPLYSMVPSGITGHTSAYYDRYGDPSLAKAKQTLREAGITEPVKLTLGYTTDRYGETMKEEFEELQRQLNASKLFEVKIKGQPWDEFQKAYQNGEYPVFGRSWYPDFPDADNYIGPFLGESNALDIPYENDRVTEEILPESRRQTDRATASDSLKEAQKLLAKDARLLPLWQARIYLAAQKDVAGTEWAIDQATLMRVWELHRKSSW